VSRLSAIALSGALLPVFAAGCHEDALTPTPPRDAGGDAPTDAPPDAPDSVPPVPYPVQVSSRRPPTVDCGPGCRVLLGPVNHADGFSFAETTAWVADTNINEMMFRRPGDEHMSVIEQHASQSYMEGRLLAFTLTNGFPKLDKVVLDVVTLEAKTYFHTEEGDDFGSMSSFLTDKYFFWAHAGGTTRADLETGELTTFGGHLDCDRGCYGGGAIYCGLGKVYRFDPETLVGTPADDGGASQIDATCSPDHKRIAWVDFRDPPGPGSGMYGPRIGGEIYMHEIETGRTTRLTFDSPDNPITKSTAAIDDDVAAWMEPCAACPKNFDNYFAWTGAPRTIVRLDIPTGKRCRYEKGKTGGYFSVHGRHLYTYWTNDIEQYLIDIDMDDPAVPWVCEP
jgi:hypothetical protein